MTPVMRQTKFVWHLVDAVTAHCPSYNIPPNNCDEYTKTYSIPNKGTSYKITAKSLQMLRTWKSRENWGTTENWKRQKETLKCNTFFWAESICRKLHYLDSW